MKNLLFINTLILLLACSCFQKKRPIKGKTEFQKKINANYKDASKSPLKKRDLIHFKGLDFFELDSTYIVVAYFKKTPNEKAFRMKTSTTRRPLYIKYGELTFNLKGKFFKLNIYQNGDPIEKDNDLFLPFLDQTSGLESYGGGRYIDIKIPKDTTTTVTIDFNKAYNPYCAYNEKYSCPIVPKNNYLKTRIEAGVRAFNKH